MKISISLGLQDSEKWGDKDIHRANQEAHINLPNPGGTTAVNKRRRPSFGKPQQKKSKPKKQNASYTKADVNVERIGNSQRYKFTDPKGKTTSTNWAGVERKLRDFGITLTSTELKSLRGYDD